MNIKIDEETANKLFQLTSSKIIFGSHIKEQNDDLSDLDLLCIIDTPEWFSDLPFSTTHLLHFKQPTVDYVFTTKGNFVSALVNGDAPLFHEILRTKALQGSDMNFLMEYEIKFLHTYNILKSYLGMCRRDLTDISKLFKNISDTMILRKINKKIKIVCETLNYISKEYMKDGKNFELFQLNKNTTYVEMANQRSILLDTITPYRNIINIRFFNGELSKTISYDDYNIISKKLESIVQYNKFTSCKTKYIELLYNSYIK